MSLSGNHTNRVLVVDNDPAVARGLASSLEALDPQVTVDTASDFHAALSRVQQTRYGLLLVDYNKPNLNGIDLAQAAHWISPHARVTVMTTSKNPALRETARILGIPIFMVRPFRAAPSDWLFRHDSRQPRHHPAILLLEKSHRLRNNYAAGLRKRALNVFEAGTLEETRDLFAERCFNVFVCPLNASRDSAADFVRRYRFILQQAGTLVVGITSDGSYDSNWEQMGVDYYLQTPVATDLLATLVQRITSLG